MLYITEVQPSKKPAGGVSMFGNSLQAAIKSKVAPNQSDSDKSDNDDWSDNEISITFFYSKNLFTR